jgi:hypothetical protein
MRSFTRTLLVVIGLLLAPWGSLVSNVSAAQANKLAVGVVALAPFEFKVLLDAFFSPQFLKIVFSVLGGTFAIGVLMYYLERRRNPEDFGGKRSQGLLYGLYWSATMMTGVGADAPRTGAGRVIGILCVIAGLFLASSFTASITRVLTSELLSGRIRSESDLRRQHVAVLAGLPAETLRRMGAIFSVYGPPRMPLAQLCVRT